MHYILHSLVLLMLLFTPTRTPVVSIRDEDKTPETLTKEFAKNKYFVELALELRNRFGLVVEPRGWPMQQPEIYFISFTTYSYDDVSSVEQARQLIVNVSSFILSYINDNHEIVHFLANNPITPDKMFFSITFVKNCEVEDGWACVTLDRGDVFYTYVYHKVKVPSETFEEAKAKVAASKA